MISGPMQIAQPNGNPQRCAFVPNSDNTVINIIIAAPAVDPSSDGAN